MKIAITGATGMIGAALANRLRAEAHTIYPVVRGSAKPGEIHWNPDAAEIDAGSFDGLDAVVHLAGESIADGRWTEAKKTRIRESRVEGTTLLSETLAKLPHKPGTLVCAPATGYYGDRGNEVLTEDAPRGKGFLPEVCSAWENACQAARVAGIRVVNVRIGIVLSTKGGALASMLTPFKLCVGGKVGNGEQYWSWITLRDMVNVLEFVLRTPALYGPVNAVAPQAATNKEFTKALGAALSRPTILPMPAFAARLALGQMADDLLLASSNVKPQKLQQQGFSFEQPDLKPALASILHERK